VDLLAHDEFPEVALGPIIDGLDVLESDAGFVLHGESFLSYFVNLPEFVFARQLSWPAARNHALRPPSPFGLRRGKQVYPLWRAGRLNMNSIHLSRPVRWA
jgi:hypothetical protein